MEQTKYDIFISYSRKDSEIVLPVVKSLEDEGYKVWIDVKGIECSEQFKRKIVDVIESSTVFLFFSSKDSNASEWTAKEIGIAVYAKKPIIPIKLDEASYNKSVMFDLINLDFADYATDPKKAMEKVHKTIISHCGIPQKQKDLEEKARKEKMEQDERERQLRLKHAELKGTYNTLHKQYVESRNKRNEILKEMLNYSMDVSKLAGLEEQADTINSLEEEWRRKVNSLENEKSELESNLRDLEAKINSLEEEWRRKAHSLKIENLRLESRLRNLQVNHRPQTNNQKNKLKLLGYSLGIITAFTIGMIIGYLDSGKSDYDVPTKDSIIGMTPEEMNKRGNEYYEKKDYAEAVKWYRKAAEQGDKDAQNSLGYMYKYGYGITQDYAEAVKWYRKATEQGDKYAQNNLGVMYQCGYGVTQDYAEAVKWYRKAAEQGDKDAQKRLEELTDKK